VVVLGAVTAFAVMAVALLFVGSSSAARVADNARALHWANATSGSAAVTRAAIAQAVVFGFDYELEIASIEARDAAIAEAEISLEALRGWIDQQQGSYGADAATASDLQELQASAEAALALVTSGDPSGAQQVVSNRLEPSFRRSGLALENAAAGMLDRIDSSEGTAGLIAMITRLAITLLIPVGAVLVFRGIMLRRYRDARIKFEAEMSAQQEVSRAKDEFIAGVSHELRTPLTGIYGFSEVLVDGGMADRSEAVELVGLIHKEAVGLTRLVEDMLVAARLDLGSLGLQEETVAVVDEVNAVTDIFLRAGHSIEARCRPGLVRADGTRLRQILRNLVDNCFRHGGSNVWVLGEPKGDWYALAVVDDGPGVPSDLEDSLFERFRHSREDAAVPSRVGLGLAVARSLALRMGGDVSYRRADKWTVFTVVLPVPRAEEIAGASGRSSPRPLPEPAPVAAVETPAGVAR
jgi:signal transduction histidine kinase